MYFGVGGNEYGVGLIVVDIQGNFNVVQVWWCQDQFGLFFVVVVYELDMVVEFLLLL